MAFSVARHPENRWGIRRSKVEWGAGQPLKKLTRSPFQQQMLELVVPNPLMWAEVQPGCNTMIT